MSERIFVSIAAFRDPELARTVRDLFSFAERPHKLTVCILDQSEESAALPAKPRGAKLHYERCHPSDSRGACWARWKVQQKLNGEDYYLQLDSHHVFKRGWDRIAREELARCPSANPVLTSYLPPYELVKGRPRKNAAAAAPMHFSHFDHDGVVIYRAYSYAEEKPRAPHPARFFSGHFTFAKRDFVEQVPYDPELYFYGEESTLAARAFTHGFDLFHPGRTIAWHHYIRQGRPRHWDSAPELGLKDGWVALQRQGVQKYRRIFCLLPHVSAKDGLGWRRTLQQYEAWCGVDHYWHVAHKATTGLQPPPASLAPDWTVSEGFLTQQELRVELPELAKLDSRPAAQVHLAVLDSTSRDAAAKRVTSEEYDALQKNGWQVQARFRGAPLRLVVWPLIGNQWGNRHESHLDIAAAISAHASAQAIAKTPPSPSSVRRSRPRSKKSS